MGRNKPILIKSNPDINAPIITKHMMSISLQMINGKPSRKLTGIPHHPMGQSHDMLGLRNHVGL